MKALVNEVTALQMEATDLSLSGSFAVKEILGQEKFVKYQDAMEQQKAQRKKLAGMKAKKAK